MNMSQREKILAVGLLLVGVFYFGRKYFQEWFIEPVDTRKTELSELKKEVDNLEFQDMQLLAAKTRVINETRRGLPPEALLAQRIYQEWVTELANIYRFQNLEVKPEGRSTSKEAYTSVRVGLTGLANYEQLCRFLASFENADILHRISSLHLECNEHRGNPLIEIALTAEALAMPESPMRDSVFPRFYLEQPLSAEVTLITPKQTAGFPAEESFLVRIGNELMRVAPQSAAEWKLTRGVEGTAASAHEIGDEVELFKLREDRPPISEEEFESILADNFFLKPAPPVEYDPHWVEIGDKVVIKGNSIRFQARAEDFPPETPPRRYSIIGDSPPDLQLDPESGDVTWDPGEDVEVGTYPLMLAVRVEGEDAPRFSEELTLTLKEPNLSPVLSEIEPQTAIPGVEYVLQLDAFDFETGNDDLSFSIDGNYPEGVDFDRERGVLTWTPPPVALPADYEFSVSVTDDGDPPETATRTVQLSLIEDLTRDTYLTGIIKPGSDLRAMLYNRAEDETTVLKEGEPFEAAGIKGQVLMIGRDFVLWQTDGKLWQLYLGKNLHSRSKASLGGP